MLDSSNSNTKYLSIQGDNGDCNINAPAGSLVLQQGGTSRVTVSSGGAAISGGITASSGSNRIELSTDGSIEITRSTVPFIDFKTSTSEDFDCRIQEQSNGLAFSTGGNGSTGEHMRIDSSGNVGIGTTSPTDDLHVSGSARFNNVVPSYTDTNGTSSSSNYFKLGTITLHSSQGAVITVMGTTSYSAGNNVSGETKIYLRGNNSVSTLTGHFFGTTLGNATVQGVRWKNTGSNNVFDIWIVYGGTFAGLEHYVDTDGTWTSNVSDTGSTSAPSGSTALTSVFAVTTAGTERMRIDSSGNVGIATTSPSSSFKLDVVGKIRSSDDILINTGSLFVNQEGQGIHLLSANGTEYKLTVSNAGALVITEQ